MTGKKKIKQQNVESEKNLYIPKIIHRIWFSWDKSHPYLPEKYKEWDKTLKSLHQDWNFMEWDEESVANFIQQNYPKLVWEVYSTYDVAVKKHDAARYLIVNHFGGVFIQHSIKLQKSITNLLTNAEVIFSFQQRADTSFMNGFFASVPNHKVWKDVIAELTNTKISKKYVTLATGPKFLAGAVSKYQEKAKDSTIKILDYHYLFPFSWKEAKNNPVVQSKCIQNDSECFELFPDAYGFCTWSGSWLKQYDTDL